MDEIFVGFLNTAWYIRHDVCADPLETCDWIGNLPPRDCGGDAADGVYDAGRWMRLRGKLAAAADRVIVTGRLDDGQAAWLNGRLRLYPVRWQLVGKEDGYELSDQPSAAGYDQVEYRILKSFAACLADGGWRNLRRCGNADCRWLFFDKSKSHSRKWCSNTCASLIKVRRHRAAGSANGKD